MRSDGVFEWSPALPTFRAAHGDLMLDPECDLRQVTSSLGTQFPHL